MTAGLDGAKHIPNMFSLCLEHPTVATPQPPSLCDHRPVEAGDQLARDDKALKVEALNLTINFTQTILQGDVCGRGGGVLKDTHASHPA